MDAGRPDLARPVGAADLVAKLGHPLPDVRSRAAHSLAFKLKHKLAKPDHLFRNAEDVVSILGILELENDFNTDLTALELLVALASGSAPLCSQLLAAGLPARLATLKASKPAQLQPWIEQAADAIASLPHAAAFHQQQASVPAAPSLVSPAAASAATSQTATPCFGADATNALYGRVAAHRPLPKPVAWFSRPSSVLTSSVADSNSVAGAPGSARGSVDGGSTGAHDGAQGQRSYHHHYQHQQDWRQTAAELKAYMRQDAAALASAASHAAGSSARPPLPTAADLRSAAASAAAADDAGGSSDPDDFLLAPVAVSAAEEHLLHDLLARLDVGGDARLVMPALLSLSEVAVLEFPPEALIDRGRQGHGSITDAVLALLRGCCPFEPQLVTLAATFLSRLAARLKAAVQMAADASFAAEAAPADGYGTSPTRPGHAGGSNTVHSHPCYPTYTARRGSDASPQAQPPSHDSSSGATPVNVSQASHHIALHVVRCLHDPRHHHLMLPLLEQLLLLALPALPATTAAAAARDASAVRRGRISELLHGLALALNTTLAMARAERASSWRAGAGAAGGDACDRDQATTVVAINVPSANLLCAAAKLLTAAAPEICTSSSSSSSNNNNIHSGSCGDQSAALVPSSLLDLLAAVACDAAICGSLPPSFMAALRPVLAAGRPQVSAVLDVVDGAGRLVQLAEEAVRDGQLELQPAAEAAQQWLARVSDCLPVLDVCADPSILRGLLHGMTRLCRHLSAPHAAAASCRPLVTAVLLRLLTHTQPYVRQAAYAWMQVALCGEQQQQQEEEEDKQGNDQAASVIGASGVAGQLLCSFPLLEHMAVVGLGGAAQGGDHEPTTRCLMALTASGPDNAKQGLCCLLLWVAAHEAPKHQQQPAVQQLSLTAALTSSYQSIMSAGGLPPCSWARLLPDVWALFSASPAARQAAAQRLAYQLRLAPQHEAGGAAAALQQPPADPLAGLLDGGAGDDLAATSSSSAAARLARCFTASDVLNLAAVLCSSGLAPELRRSAAEQLTSLAAEPSLLRPVCTHHLVSLLFGLARPGSAGRSAAERLGDDRPSTSAPQQDALMPVAAMNLLYVMSRISGDVQGWAAASSDEWLPPLLPHLFSPTPAVRRAAARLLALFAFVPSARLWSGWQQACTAGLAPSGDVDGGAEAQSGMSATSCSNLEHNPRVPLQLPAPFTAAFRFPFRVSAVPVLPASVASASQADSSSAAGVQVSGLLCRLSPSQRRLVQTIVAQRRLLHAVVAAEQPLSAMQLLRQQGGAASGCELPPQDAQATAYNVDVLRLPQQVAAALRQVEAAGCHDSCLDALRRLQQLSASAQGMTALAHADWQRRLRRLLSAAPASEDDRLLWAEMLALLEALLLLLPQGSADAPRLTARQHCDLAAAFQHSLLPALRATKAATLLPVIPLALAHSDAVEDIVDGSSRSQLALQHRVLRVLLAYLTSVDARLAPPDRLAALQPLQLPDLVRLLAQHYAACHTAAPGCRLLACQALDKLLECLCGGDVSDVSGDSGCGPHHAVCHVPGLHDALQACMSQLLSAVCVHCGRRTARMTVSPRPPALTTVADVLQRPDNAGSPTRCYEAGSVGAGASGFACKSLLLCAMSVVARLFRCLGTQDWSDAWAAAGGAVWLSCCLSDRQAQVRAGALNLLAAMLAPRADATLRLLQRAWPECGGRLVSCALDASEPYCVRAAALRCLACVLALPLAPRDSRLAACADAPGAGSSTNSSSSSSEQQQQHADVEALLAAKAAAQGLSPQAMLVDTQLWEGVAGMVAGDGCGGDVPACFTGAALSLLLSYLAVDPDAAQALVARRSLMPHIAGHHLDFASLLVRHAPVLRAAQRLEAMAGCGSSSDLVAAAAAASASSAAGPAAAIVHLYMCRHGWAAAPVEEEKQDDASTDKSSPFAGLAPGQLASTLLALFVSMAAQPLARLASARGDAGATTQLNAAASAALHQQLAAIQSVAAAAATAVQQLPADAALQHVAAVPSDGSPPLLVAVALLLRSQKVSQGVKTALSCLAAALLQHDRLACRLLADPAACCEWQLPGSAGGATEPVGGQLCTALLGLLPPGALAPPAAADEGDCQHDQVTLCPAGLTLSAVHACTALRNALAHSASAKAALLSSGAHAALVDACLAAAAALGRARRAAAAANKSAGAAVPARSDAAAASTPASAASAVKRAAMRVMPSATINARKSKDQSKLRTAAMIATKASSSAPGAAAAAAVSSPLPQPSLPPPQSRVTTLPQPPTATATATVDAARSREDAAPTTVTQSARVGPVLLQRLQLALTLLKHAAYGADADAKRVMLQQGAMEAAGQVWAAVTAVTNPAAVIAGGAATGAAHLQAVATELWDLVTNLLPGCPDARHALATTGQPSLLCRAVQLLLDVGGRAAPVPPSSGLSLATKAANSAPSLFGEGRAAAQMATLLVHLCATADGTAYVVRLTPLLPQLAQSVFELSGQTELHRLQHALHVLTCVAAHPEGQAAILQCGATPSSPRSLFTSLVDMVDLVAPPPPPPRATGSSAASGGGAAASAATAASAMAALRNLLFSPNAVPHALADPRLLPRLLEAVERGMTAAAVAAGGAAVVPAAAASSALWVLLHHCQKAKAALKQAAADALPRLAAAKEAADGHLLPGGTPAAAEVRDLLQRTSGSLAAVLDLMHRRRQH